MDSEQTPSKYREVSVFALAATLYFAVRELVEGSTGRAEANARHLVDIERALHIDIERSIQRFVLDHAVLIELANRAYVWLHWPFLVFAFVVLWRRDRAALRRLRDALIASGAAGLVIFAVLPVAPPRFLPGFVGTVSQAERQHFLTFPADWQNRYASLPSFHAGWTLLAALALASVCSRRATKLAALAPAPLVAMAVIATGNHFVIDVIVGVALSLGASAFVKWRVADRKRATEHRPQVPHHFLAHRPWLTHR